MAFDAIVLDSYPGHTAACVMSQHATAAAPPMTGGWRCLSVVSSSLQVFRRMKLSMALCVPLRARCLDPSPPASLPYFSLYVCRVCFCSLFYDASSSLIPDNNLGELEQTGWPVLAGHRSGCLLRFWLWLSWREWGSGSGWHGAAPRKQTRAPG